MTNRRKVHDFKYSLYIYNILDNSNQDITLVYILFAYYIFVIKIYFLIIESIIFLQVEILLIICMDITWISRGYQVCSTRLKLIIKINYIAAL